MLSSSGKSFFIKATELTVKKGIKIDLKIWRKQTYNPKRTVYWVWVFGSWVTPRSKSKTKINLAEDLEFNSIDFIRFLL